MALLETKFNNQSLARFRNKLRDWNMVDNFCHHPNGRIVVIWKEELVAMDILEPSDQAIHSGHSGASGISFSISFIYAFNSAMGRRFLWENLFKFSSMNRRPWILSGDFNNVLSNDERNNGLPVSTYEIRDFQELLP